MLVTKLFLYSFRAFEEKTIDFVPGINWIFGPNAIGKTTVLEGLYLLLTGRSFRTSKIFDMARFESEFFHVETHFYKNSIEQTLRLIAHKEERTTFHNSTKLPSLNTLLGILQGVLLAPQDIELIKGSPEIRRHYLNLQLAQVDPLYVHHLVRYTKALKQRNQLLKEKKKEAIDSFEMILSQSASYILQKRLKLIISLEKRLNPLYYALSGKEEAIQLKYTTSMGQDFSFEALVKKYHHQRAKEYEVGCTLIGPHRDDVKILLKQQEARQFASEGETRSLAASLRLAEWEEMAILSEQSPLLLIDDFGMGLDPERQNNLWRLFDTKKQVILSSAYSLKKVINHNNFNYIDLT